MPDPITPLATPGALWSRAKSDYLEGVTADEACRRYGLSRSRFFERAKAEGWRRADRLPAVDDEDEVAIDGDTPLPAARALADRAWRRAERAIAKGLLQEAQAWTRLTRDLRRLALDETGNPSWRHVLKSDPPPPPPPAPEPAPSPAAVTPRLPLTRAEIPPEVWEDADAIIAWMGHAWDDPHLLAEAGAEGRGKAGLAIAQSGLLTAEETGTWTEEPDFPDSEDESVFAPPAPLGEDPEGWAAWAMMCERMRKERPEEPWWGKEIGAWRAGAASPASPREEDAGSTPAQSGGSPPLRSPGAQRRG